MCDEFFYRVEDNVQDLFQHLNTSKENVLRNNEKIDLYCGEWIKVKKNNYISYHVKPTDTLSKIASQFNQNKEKIASDNSLNSEKLFIGQILKIYD